MGLRKIIRQMDLVKINRYANDGHDAGAISNALGLDYERVCDVMPKKKKKKKAPTTTLNKPVEKMPPPVPGSTSVS